jgi:hypothetical protein
MVKVVEVVNVLAYYARASCGKKGKTSKEKHSPLPPLSPLEALLCGRPRAQISPAVVCFHAASGLACLVCCERVATGELSDAKLLKLPR